MDTTAKLYSLSFTSVKTYVMIALFAIGNLLFPLICHLIPQGGFILLPIYFFTLVAAYKYGWQVGVLTALLSPLANYLLFGMPPLAVLPIIIIKSIILAVVAAGAAKYYGKISLLGIIIAILVYQLLGSAIDLLFIHNFSRAFQDFSIGGLGLLFQAFVGFLVLKVIAKY